MTTNQSSLHRRHFLTASLTSAAVLGLGGPTSHAANIRTTRKAGTDLPVVGHGEFTYECQHNWDRAGLPADFQYGNASHGVAIDEQGLIYITHQGNPGSVFIFDADARFVRAIGDIHNIKTSKGHGIDIRREGSEEFIYLSPSETTLNYAKLTLSGELVWKKDRATISKESGGMLDNPRTAFRPTNTSFRPDGGYYLGDGYGSNLVFEYDKNDKFVRAIGGKGSGDGQFATPHGQWLDSRDGNPKLVVADRANKRLQWFDLQGTHLKTQDGFLFPADIDTQGQLMLVPDLHARITILDGSNTPVAQLGDDERWRSQVLAGNNAMRAKPDQWKDGRFVHPHDACFDSEGNIFVVEWVRGGRVTKLVRRI